MKVAFLNLCHCDPKLVKRTTDRLTKNNNFGMFVHVDAKVDIEEFENELKDCKNLTFTDNRHKVFWGGYNAINATIELLKCALESDKEYEYFVLLQNLDYPIKSNEDIEDYFIKHKGKEFIRGCPIANSEEEEFRQKYKRYYFRDTVFANKGRKDIFKIINSLYNDIMSLTTKSCDGTLTEGDKKYDMYYGSAQWAITRKCAEFLVKFNEEHKKFNKRMSRVQYPDELYFHTIIHNSKFKKKCMYYDEKEKLWLVNWRNLHYFEFPKEVTVFDEKDFDKLIKREELFCRKVSTGKSDKLLDLLDKKLM